MRVAKTFLLCAAGLAIAALPSVSAAQTNAPVSVEPAQAVEQVEAARAGGDEVDSAFSGVHVRNTLGDITGDLVFFPLAPCRLYDSRTATAVGLGGPMAPNTTRNISVNDSLGPQGGNAAGCGVPVADPPALAITLTAIDPTGPGNLRTFANGDAVPVAATLVYNTGLLTGTGAITPSSATGAQSEELAIRNQGGGSTNVAVDVTGYFTKATVPLGRAYAKVVRPVGFEAARTKGFSSVTNPSTGIYCLTLTDATMSAANSPVMLSVEWDNSLGSDLLAFHSESAGGCPAGTDIGVRTYNFPAGTPALSNNISFYVWLP